MDASDVQGLLDRLEELLGRARRVPLTGKLLVDEEKAYGILQEIRRRLPDELRQARWLRLERERGAGPDREGSPKPGRGEDEPACPQGPLDAAAPAEARPAAPPQAQEVLERARQVAREIRRGALEYADEALREALEALEAAAEALSKGRSELKASRQA